MKSKFEQFLESLDDHELSIYIGYQYESLLNHSREILKNEIALRGLSKKRLEELLNTKFSYLNGIESARCERCGSNKFFEDIDTEYGNGKYTTNVYEVKTKRCRLCNLNPSKDPPKNIVKRIKWYLFDKNNSKKVTFIKTLDWFDD
jgi:hypothetical protein